MTDPCYDLCVIGGGIHGAGVAQAAAARGHTVLVLEKTALAAGTSSRSSKLIHGGLRYLESAQFSLVRECLREREILLRIAPELVKLQSFIIPVYKNTRRRPWLLRTGLSMYALLGGLRRENLFSTVSEAKWDTLDGLRTDRLGKVFCYQDAQTDDRLLTQAVMNSAIDLGAELSMPATFLESFSRDGQVEVHYERNGTRETCKVNAVVNAAGPWITRVAEKMVPDVIIPPIELVQGTHIEVEGEMVQGMYYLEAPQDGRAVFVMPWHGHTLVGTTETPIANDPDTVQPREQEQDYLQHVLQHYFPRYSDTASFPVLASFAGARVLPHGSGKVFGRSRDTTLVADDERRPRVITIVGGKLTAYRATAGKVMDRLRSTLPERAQRADTATLVLSASHLSL